MISSFFAKVALWCKSGRKTATFFAIGFGLACMLMLASLFVNVLVPRSSLFEHLVATEDKIQTFVDSLKIHRGYILFKCFIQFIFLAYINFYGLPRVCELGQE